MTKNLDIHNFDILDSDYVQDIHAVFGEMNRSGQVTRADTYGGHWVVTGYDAVRKAALDWESFTSTQGVMHPAAGPVDMPPITADPPLQQGYRKLLTPHFTPTVAASLEQSIRSHARALIETFVADGVADLSVQYAEPFVPLVFLDDIVHAPRDFRDRYLAANVGHGGTPDQHTTTVVDMVEELIAVRRGGPRYGDVIDSLFEGTIDDEPLTDQQIVKVATILLIGGTDTTRNVILTALWYLAEHPELRTRLMADDTVMAPFLEEMLRMYGSVQLMGRTVTREVTLGEVTMSPGDKVVLSPAAANRDPAEFDHADEFDPDRSVNRHIAFGAGVHRCLGSNLARVEIQIALEEILAAIPDYALAPGYAYRRRIGHVHGPETLPIVFTPPA